MSRIYRHHAPIGSGTIRVLVTGFGPFAGYEENPSWLAVKPLHNTIVESNLVSSKSPASKPTQTSIHITALEVPVTYDAVLSVIPGIHSRPPSLPPTKDSSFSTIPPPVEGYDFVFHVGVAGQGPRLEKLAHKSGYFMPDVVSKYAPEIPASDPEGKPSRGFGAGYEAFDDELFTLIDVDALVDYLNQNGVKEMYSYTDPGRYLCDFIYYCSLSEAKRTADEVQGDGVEPKKTRVLFFHCPPVDKPLSTTRVTEAIQKTVYWVCSNSL